MKLTINDRVRELKGDLPREMILSGEALDKFAKECYDTERFVVDKFVETDEALRARLLNVRLLEHIQTNIMSTFLDNRKHVTNR